MAPKAISASSQGQQTISSFFAKKRKSSPIDLTADDLDEPPAKRLKSKEANATPVDKGKSRVASSGLPVNDGPSKWRFSLPLSDVTTFNSPIGFASGDTGKKTGRNSSTHRSAATLTFREKLRRRDLIEKDRDILPPKSSGSIRDDEPERQSTCSSAMRLREFVADSPLPLEKGTGSRKGRKSGTVIGPEGIPCTPLEESVIKFKNEYPDTVLLIEVGYKYCFFGNDAKIAARVLGFFYGLEHNFLRTSCPVHNLKVNIKKLVAAGHKVGVISQVETAALKKAGDNRNTLFDRQLTHLYTPSTFVDDLDSFDDFGEPTPPLLCIVEEVCGGVGPDDKVLFGIISVIPSTGDVVYDEFKDTLLRTELETRLAHTRPCELLIPSKLSAPTEKMLRHFAEHGHSGRVRVEKTKHQSSYSEAFDYVSQVYEKRSDHIASLITDLPQLVVVALALALKHLSAFELSDALLQIKFFHEFTTRAHMLLDTSTIRNLEIYRNQTDFTEKGTLFAVLNHTATIFGKRLLRSWVGRPLVDKHVLQQRVDAVEEARLGDSPRLTHLRGLLKGLPDLARGLSGIQYGRCTPKELATFLTAMNRVGATFPSFREPAEVECSSIIWTDIIFALPALQAPMKEILASISLHRARENSKAELWTDLEKFPLVEEAQFAIMAVESDLAEELKKIRKLFRIQSLNYVNISSEEYLIEIPKDRASSAPANWIRTGSTKNVTRFHTPEVIKLLQQREQSRETLQAEADKAYQTFLRDIAQQHYTLFRGIVNKLATADCLMSLAILSLHGDFCKPSFVDGSSLSIVDGRHPIIEQVRSEPFIPNTIFLGGDAPRNLVISGPNMGGKTSVVKLVALLVLMAQIGSYVPARSMSLSMHDAILTRMGASDDLAAGRSTFMVEIAETREIIKSATQNSLVVLDELGVGTSTFDGMAIAGAVLEYLCQEVKCKTLFITHYPTIARELEARYPRDIGNRYMNFKEDTRIDGRREIRFLYQLTEGISKGSFGIECARLAGLPEPILQEATSKAVTMQYLMKTRSRHASAKNMLRLLGKCVLADGDKVTLHEVKTQRKIMGL